MTLNKSIIHTHRQKHTLCAHPVLRSRKGLKSRQEEKRVRECLRIITYPPDLPVHTQMPKHPSAITINQVCLVPTCIILDLFAKF